MANIVVENYLATRYTEKTLTNLIKESSNKEEFEDRLSALDEQENFSPEEIETLGDYFGYGNIADNIGDVEAWDNVMQWGEDNEDILVDYFQEDQENNIFPELAGKRFEDLSYPELYKYTETIARDDEYIVIDDKGTVFRCVP